MKNLVHAPLGAAAIVAGLLGAQGCWKVAPDARTLPDGSTDDGGGTPAEGAPPAEGGSSDGTAGDSGSADAAEAEVDAGTPFASTVIAAGVAFGCDIVQGQVFCWGDDTFGQAGSTPSSTVVAHPQLVPLVPPVVTDAGDGGDAGDAGASGPIATAIAVGDHHACALTASQAVYCWGLNDAYQLGHPSASSGDVICPGLVAGQTLPCQSTPTLVGADPAVAIGAAGAWTCVVTSSGSVQCWGAAQGSAEDGGVACGLGEQAQGGTCYPAPYTVGGVTGVIQLAVAFDHACAIVPGSSADAGNQVACWGNNNEGQVSPAACPQSDCASPITRSDLPTTAGLAAGTDFTCALDPSGAVRCFGDNTYGQLGHAPGTSGDLGAASAEAGLGVYNPTPGQVGGLGTAASLVGGGNESACALIEGGSVQCWGNVSAGGGAMPSPVTIAGLPTMSALGAYDSTTACGVAAAGTIWCWSIGPGPGATQVQ